MKRVVLESPYRGDVATNEVYARACVLDALRKGEAPFASHLLYTQTGILDDNDPEGRELGMRAGRAWIAPADKMVVYIDPGISPGMLRAIREAHKLRLTIEYRRLSPERLKELGLNDPGIDGL